MEFIERAGIRAFIRWNAAVMVSRGNRPGNRRRRAPIATYAVPRPSLYEVGFNHFLFPR